MDAAAKTKADAMAGGMESGGREGVVGTQNNPIMVSPQRLHSIPQGRTASTTAGNTLWALSDHLGSVRDVVDNNGVIRQHVVYDSFGRRLREVDYNSAGAVIASTDPAAVDELFGYTGHDWDVDTQLQNNRARWYDPATGRWLSQDPIGFAAGDANLYRYVGNRPTNATDPSGLDTIWIEGVEYYLLRAELLSYFWPN